jgi:hypothetical protein
MWGGSLLAVAHRSLWSDRAESVTWRLDARTPDRRRATPTLVVGVVLTVVLAGCGGQVAPSADGTAVTPTETEPPTPAVADRMDSALLEVSEASDPARAASRRDLTTRDGTVLVAVTLAEGRSLPADPPVEVRSRADGRVLGYVAYGDLRALAAHSNVTYVSVPERVEVS